MADILIIEDDLSFARMLGQFLNAQGYTSEAQHSLRDARKAIVTTPYRLVLLDYHLPDGNGLEWLEQLKKNGISMPVIIMTSFNDVRTAVRAIREGVVDYITKPLNPEELLMRIREILATPVTSGKVAEPLVTGIGPAALKIQHDIQLLAPTDMSVLIQGESGTGKENVARTLHLNSKRAQKPFVAIDCGALSEELAASELFGHVKGAFTGALFDKAGHFVEAEGGTVFLDEIGNLSYAIQVKLLRVLQERVVQPVGANKTIHIDVRLIAATNEDLQHKVNAGTFRADLYHRLNEFLIVLPPLRERSEDLDRFVDYFIRQSNAELGKDVKGLSAAAHEVIVKYDWPGNLRELKNVIKRSVLLCPRPLIGTEELPEEMLQYEVRKPIEKNDTQDLKAMNEANEKELILKTLKQVKNNKSKAATLLNIDRKTLYLKMARYGIEK